MTHVPSRLARGAALLVVLWLVAGLALAVLSGTRAARGHLRAVEGELQRIRAQAVLDAALTAMALHLRARPDDARAYTVATVVLGEQRVEMEVVPSVGLVDPNVASEALLVALFGRVGGLADGDARVMAARVRDWIDPDDQPDGVGGAEAAQYRAAGWPVLPRNERIQDPVELLDVLGMGPEIYERISKFLGNWGSERLDIGSAPPALIDALTGQSGLGSRLMSARPEEREALWAPLTAGGLFEVNQRSLSRLWRVTAVWSPDPFSSWRQTVWIDHNPRTDTLTPWTTTLVQPLQRVLREHPNEP